MKVKEKQRNGIMYRITAYQTKRNGMNRMNGVTKSTNNPETNISSSMVFLYQPRNVMRHTIFSSHILFLSFSCSFPISFLSLQSPSSSFNKGHTTTHTSLLLNGKVSGGKVNITYVQRDTCYYYYYIYYAKRKRKTLASALSVNLFSFSVGILPLSAKHTHTYKHTQS